MTYLEVECRVEAIKTLGDLRFIDLEESLWEGKLIIEFKLSAIFSLSSTQKTLLWIDIWPWFWLCLCTCVQKNKIFWAKGKVKPWKSTCTCMHVAQREETIIRTNQNEGYVGERVGEDVKMYKFLCQTPFHFHSNYNNTNKFKK